MQLYILKEGYFLFPRYMMLLVDKWDIEELDKESIINSVTGESTVVAIRIIFKNKKHVIESISFKDFFNLDRDRLNLPYSSDIYIPVY